MSKDVKPDTSEFDPLNREFTKEKKQQQEKQKQELFSQTPPIEQEADDGIFQAPASTSTSTPSISALSGGISADGQTLDPITEAIRKEILEKQRDILREYFANTNPELAEQIAKEEEDKKFRAFLSNPDNQGLINKAFEDSDTKKKLEAAEIAGYKNVLTEHSAYSRANKIREEQREEEQKILRNYLSTAQLPEELEKLEDQYNFKEQTKDKEKFVEFLTTLSLEDPFIVALNNAMHNDLNLSKQLFDNGTKYNDRITHVGGFKPMQWNDPAGGDNTRAQIVKNDEGEEICTLNEKTHKTKPFTVAKQDGTQIQVSSYREIDFPIKLDKADGSMHLSMVALKADGTKPSKDKAVYFTAHYEEGPNGKPLLKEISSPQPLKFAGDGRDAVAYIEHGGEIYTLAVTRGKYQEMMKEVAINKGQAVDLSQAEDLIIGQGQSRGQETNEPVVTPNQGLQSSIETPTATQTTQMPQPQQAKSSGIPNPPYPHGMPMPQQVNPNLLNAATALSGSMQDLLNYVNAGLTKETDSNKQIDLIKEAATAILNNEKSDIAEKQANIIALTENTVNTKDLTPDAKVAGVNAVLETIKNDHNTPDLEKSKMLEGTLAIALNAENLDPTYKQQIVEKAVDVGLSLKDDASRAAAIDGITDAVIKSNLSTEDKGTMLIAGGDKVNASELSNVEKQKLLGSVLKKGVEASVLTAEQQQLMQQNLDKIVTEQTKNAEIAEVQGILANLAFNTIAKTEAIQNVTTKVLDSPIKAEIKGETLENITKVVAESPLNGQDKADITKGVGQAIATNKTVTLAEQVTITESAEKGIANSTTDLKDKELMTKGGVNGIYDGIAEPAVKSDLTKSVINGINNSTVKEQDKNVLKNAVSEVTLDRELKDLNKGLDQKALKDTAMEAALERETQNLNKGLQGQNIEEAKPQHDLYKAAQSVANALKGVVDPVLEAHPEKREISEEEVVKKTSGILSNVSSYVNSLRNILSSNGDLKTSEEKRAESEQKINKVNEKFNEKPSIEEKQDFIKSYLIDNKENLSKDVRLQIIDDLLKKEAEERGAAFKDKDRKSEIQVVGKDKVNIKDNVKIMESLMNAKNSIQTENLSKSLPIKRESTPPQR
ncbi:MAG: Cell surface antigen [Pseudomonadota bacterium]|jgi:hypothetical protein